MATTKMKEPIKTFKIPTNPVIFQHVEETKEFARKWTLKQKKPSEIEFFYLSTNPDELHIDGIILTKQEGSWGGTETLGLNYMEALDALAETNKTRIEQGLKPYFVIGHHHLHPSSEKSDTAPFFSAQDRPVYELVTTRVYGSKERIKKIKINDLFSEKPSLIKSNGIKEIKSDSIYDPIFKFPKDFLNKETDKPKIEMECNYRYGYAFFSISKFHGGTPFTGIGVLYRNLFFETQNFDVIQISPEIEIRDSYSIDEGQLEEQLERDFKHEEKEPEKPINTIDKIKNMFSSYNLQSTEQELTAKELMYELNNFFTVLGEKNVQKDPALNVLNELYKGLSPLQLNSSYETQLQHVRKFLSGLSDGYANEINKIEKLKNGK